MSIYFTANFAFSLDLDRSKMPKLQLVLVILYYQNEIKSIFTFHLISWFNDFFRVVDQQSSFCKTYFNKNTFCVLPWIWADSRKMPKKFNQSWCSAISNFVSTINTGLAFSAGSFWRVVWKEISILKNLIWNPDSWKRPKAAFSFFSFEAAFHLKYCFSQSKVSDVLVLIAPHWRKR